MLLDTPEAAFDYGNACLDHGDPEAAIAAFSTSLRLAPNHPPTLFNLAHAQLQARRFADGAATLVACLQITPNFAGAHVNLANALFRLGLVEDAIGAAAIAVRLAPGDVDALLCHAAILHHSGAHEEAIGLYRRVLARAPEHAGALSSLGNSLRSVGRLDESLDAHDRAMRLAPDDATFGFNRALALLTAGRYEEGWRDYELRWRRPIDRPRFAALPWRGQDIAGQTILLHADQGLGDTLQFVRYVPMVAARGARIVLEVQGCLVRLLRAQPHLGASDIVASGERLPHFDVHCPLMSLPHAFGTILETVPACVPYLHADAARTAAWRARLPQDRLLVGLVWAGSPHRDEFEAHLRDRRRSLPVDCLAGLAHLTGVQFVSLQKDATPPAIKGLPIIDAMAEVTDFADTAAVAAALDLIISVDTSCAHLAGAMGLPVWMLSRYDACWRWLRGRNDSPWYPTMRLYRQPTPWSWPDVIAQVRMDLAKHVAQAGAG